MILKKIWDYITLKKNDPETDKNVNLRMMHGINKISIFLFLFAIVVMVVRCLK